MMFEVCVCVPLDTLVMKYETLFVCLFRVQTWSALSQRQVTSANVNTAFLVVSTRAKNWARWSSLTGTRSRRLVLRHIIFVSTPKKLKITNGENMLEWSLIVVLNTSAVWMTATLACGIWPTKLTSPLSPHELPRDQLHRPGMTGQRKTKQQKLDSYRRVPFTSVSKRVQVRNQSYENEFYSQVYSNANQTHFHMKGFALGLVLKQRQKATWKWSIVYGGFIFLYFLHVGGKWILKQCPLTIINFYTIWFS